MRAWNEDRGKGGRTSQLEIKFVVKSTNIFAPLNNKKYMAPVSFVSHCVDYLSVCLSVSHVAYSVLCIAAATVAAQGLIRRRY